MICGLHTYELHIEEFGLKSPSLAINRKEKLSGMTSNEWLRDSNSIQRDSEKTQLTFTFRCNL